MLAPHFVLGVFGGPCNTFRWPTKEAFVPGRDAAFAAMGGLERSQSSWGLANLCWNRNAGSRASKPLLAQHFVPGVFAGPYNTFQCTGMLAPGLANLRGAACSARRFETLKGDFGSLLKKPLFLGRTLLLRLWVLGTYVRKRLGRRGEQPEQLGASNVVLVQECWLQG